MSNEIESGQAVINDKDPYKDLFLEDPWSIASEDDGKLFDAVHNEVKQRMIDSNWDDDDAEFVALGAREIFINAAMHGNKYDSEKFVTVKIKVTESRVKISIADEGKGFDRKEVADATKEGILETSGRGILFANKFLDSVKYNEKGNEVTLIKERKQ